MDKDFNTWYADIAKKNKLDANPDSPLHFYDYKAAYKAGSKLDAKNHLPSTYKTLGHPNLIVNGKDTRNGKPATEKLVFLNKVANRVVVNHKW